MISRQFRDNSATNPRRWIVNEGKIDVSTDEGKAIFREALLKLADSSIKVLKETNAQGMITLDPDLRISARATELRSCSGMHAV